MSSIRPFWIMLLLEIAVPWLPFRNLALSNKSTKSPCVLMMIFKKCGSMTMKTVDLLLWFDPKDTSFRRWSLFRIEDLTLLEFISLFLMRWRSSNTASKSMIFWEIVLAILTMLKKLELFFKMLMLTSLLPFSLSVWNCKLKERLLTWFFNLFMESLTWLCLEKLSKISMFLKAFGPYRAFSR